MRALLSASDRVGLVDFARQLSAIGYELISTGGTGRELAAAGLKVRQVADVTGAPEILDGRVKTLHPKIHGGILARRGSADHRAQMEAHGIVGIDVVVCNLYPFVRTVGRPGVSIDDALENIDIGGPAMVRAAAKNYPDVVVVVDPGDYAAVGDLLQRKAMTMEMRRKLAARAFAHVSTYDAAVAEFLRRDDPDALFPKELAIGMHKVRGLRYGENPHQKAALYAYPGESGGVAGAVLHHGKEMSYINYLDADAAWKAAAFMPGTAVSIVKHANTCGLAVNDDQVAAYRLALEGDPVSAYGGIVGFNSALTKATAEAMRKRFYEVVVAPGYEPEALEILKTKKDIRLLEVQPQTRQALGLHTVVGGVLVQENDDRPDETAAWKVVSKRAPSEAERADLDFAWRACRYIKSNAIVFARERAIVGMGAGQPNRLVSVHLAARAAGERSKGAVAASDAFFPFADGLEEAASAGCTAVIQPGGSIRDAEVIEAADRHALAMVFTGTRHFLH